MSFVDDGIKQRVKYSKTLKNMLPKNIFYLPLGRKFNTDCHNQVISTPFSFQHFQISYKMNHRQQNNWYPKGVFVPISKILSILAVANLLAHNNISQICYCGQISFQSAAVNCSFSDNCCELLHWFPEFDTL